MEQIKGVPYTEAIKEAEYLIKIFNLTNYANRLVADLLRGLRATVLCATAFLSPNRIVLLDEPTEGMDVITRNRLWKSILVNILPNFFEKF